MPFNIISDFKKSWWLVCTYIFLFLTHPLCSSCNPHALKFHTNTPIKYVVVIIPEDSSFDHLFATYPKAENPPGEPYFKASRNTPTINGLNHPFFAHNTNAFPPFRLERSQVDSCRPKHSYTLAQEQAHAGLMDLFVQTDVICGKEIMGYFDGNTVTALWNYAQRFAMSDNCFTTIFGPSTPGHVNMISGQTHGAEPPNLVVNGEVLTIDGSLISSLVSPRFDDCGDNPKVELTGKNVGDLLNAKDITWGYFQGGFEDCKRTHIGSNGKPITDYIDHHEPFQFYASTANPLHLPPSSKKLIGFQDQANHQYDLKDFWIAVKNHNIPAVSWLKPPQYQNGHPGESGPLPLQTFLVKTINRLQKQPEWKEMAIFIMWDDNGGWYDHVMPPIINQSQTSADALVRPGNAGDNPPFGGYQARLAYGMRVPFLLISPFAKQNYVDHAVVDQTSLLRFIEDNWDLGRIGDFSFDKLSGSLNGIFNFRKPNYKPLFLDPKTGLVKKNS